MKLYKYTTAERGLQILESNSVVLSNPQDFNDPFDCLLYWNEEELDKTCEILSDLSLEQMFLKIISDVAPNIKKLSQRVLVRFVLWEYRMLQKAYRYKPLEYRPCFNKSKLDKIYNLCNKLGANNDKQIEGKTIIDTQIEDQRKVLRDKISSIKEIRNKFLVSCFSTNYDSILMWSHYANNHKGVCIEFDIPNGEQELYNKVIYSDTRPSNNLEHSAEKICGHLIGKGEIDKADKLFIKIMTEPYYTKSTDWAYEEEYRIIFSEQDIDKHDRLCKVKCNDGFERLAYKMPPIKRIYLGAKLPSDCPEQYNQILNLTKQKDDIEVVTLKISEDKYNLYS
jgi:hypothetical protein